MSGPSWILATTVLPGTPPAVLATFVDEIAQWFRVTPPEPVDFTVTGLQLEAVAGGRLVATGDDSEEAVLATVASWDTHTGGLLRVAADGTTAEVRVRPDGDGTRLAVDHRGLERLNGEGRDAAYRYGARLWPVWFECHVDPARTRRTGLVPGLSVRDLPTVLDWLDRTLGFVDRGRYVSDGVMQQADVTVGDTELWLGSTPPGAPAAVGMSGWTGVWVDDVDAAYERVRAVDAGVKPPEDKNYGVRMFSLTDPEGHLWGVMSRIDPAIGDPILS
jgi:uncharacterized glyoxalase superfamily protein PhnB